jgi:hypothetical protein
LQARQSLWSRTLASTAHLRTRGDSSCELCDLCLRCDDDPSSWHHARCHDDRTAPIRTLCKLCMGKHQTLLSLLG